MPVDGPGIGSQFVALLYFTLKTQDAYGATGTLIRYICMHTILRRLVCRMYDYDILLLRNGDWGWWTIRQCR
jgi:hypothetical protein